MRSALGTGLFLTFDSFLGFGAGVGAGAGSGGGGGGFVKRKRVLGEDSGAREIFCLSLGFSENRRPVGRFEELSENLLTADLSSLVARGRLPVDGRRRGGPSSVRCCDLIASFATCLEWSPLTVSTKFLARLHAF